MKLTEWLKINYPDIFSIWIDYIVKERREYRRKWAKEHYLPLIINSVRVGFSMLFHVIVSHSFRFANGRFLT